MVSARRHCDAVTRASVLLAGLSLAACGSPTPAVCTVGSTSPPTCAAGERAYCGERGVPECNSDGTAACIGLAASVHVVPVCVPATASCRGTSPHCSGGWTALCAGGVVADCSSGTPYCGAGGLHCGSLSYGE